MKSPTVIVACADLMTTSRFETSGAEVDLQCVRTAAAALTAIGVAMAESAAVAVATVTAGAESGGVEHHVVVVVDLVTCGDLPQLARERFGAELVVVGFAPHVRVDLLEAARATCTRVLPRGSVVKRFADVVARSLEPGI